MQKRGKAPKKKKKKGGRGEKGKNKEKKGRGGYENKVFHSKPTLLLAYIL